MVGRHNVASRTGVAYGVGFRVTPSVSECRGGQAALVDGVTMLLTADLAAAGTVMHYPGLPTVWGDAGQLSQLFQNLLSNPDKFRQRETPPLVRVTAERQGEEWLVRVRDNGIGIAVPDAEKVFAIFQRLHSGAAYPGTGLA
jgi:light-regulated signal transduction histidine kinase (bacteriophytochrome)